MATLLNEFTTRKASELAGFETPAMVNYLCREGVVKPSISHPGKKGRKLLFSFKDVFILKIICRLLEKGLTVSKIKNAIKISKDLKSLRTDQASLECDHGPINYFITNGKDIFFVKDIGSEITNLSKNGQLEFAFILDVDEIHQTLVTKVNKLAA